MPDAKPFLHWAGGKKQLLKHIVPLIPTDIEFYLEPFVGGGAVLFALPVRPKKYHIISDVNRRLIQTYRAVHDNVEEVILLLKQMVDSEEEYYKARARFNQCTPKDFDTGEGAALFIYLNKTCFNGLYRENSSGDMNSPYGHHPRMGKTSIICDEDNLRAVSRLLVGGDEWTVDFGETLQIAGYGDFAYLDPPYVPIKENSFTKYSKDDFTPEDHEDLASICRDMDKKGARWLLSNSDCPKVRELWSGFNIREVRANRVINSKGSERTKVGELLISNY